MHYLSDQLIFLRKLYIGFFNYHRITNNRKKFEDYLYKQASEKSGKALTDELYNEIVGILKNPNPPFSNLLRRIRRNGFKLMDYPKFSLKDVLCTPIKDVS